jgi:hypothetical protein
MAKQPYVERHWCSELVSIVHRSKDGRLQSMVGNLEEIGARALVVLTERCVPLGAWVRIHCGNYDLTGTAASREFDRALGFFVKIRLAPQSRWTLRQFAPEHLFTVREVLSHAPQLRRSA